MLRQERSTNFHTPLHERSLLAQLYNGSVLPMPRRLTADSAWGALSCRVETLSYVINAADYVAHYRDVPRFLACCRQCPSYGMTWTCPPFEKDGYEREESDGRTHFNSPPVTDEEQEHCERREQGKTTTVNTNSALSRPSFSFLEEPSGGTFLLIGTRMTFDNATRRLSTTVEQRDSITQTVINTVMSDVEAMHRRWENDCPGSRAFLFSRCRQCHPQPCTRPSGLPCRHPDRMRPSLEALGFNLARTADELLKMPLQWSSDEQLPDYLTLITAQLLPKHTDIVLQTADDTV